MCNSAVECSALQELRRQVVNLASLVEHLQSPQSVSESVVSNVVYELEEECISLGLSIPYPVDRYNQDNLEEKANYYFMTKETIRNPKAYLQKLISSLVLETMKPSRRFPIKETEIDRRERERLAEEDRLAKRRLELDKVVGMVTDRMIDDRLVGNIFLTKYCKDAATVRQDPLKLYAMTELLIKDGVIKC